MNTTNQIRILRELSIEARQLFSEILMEQHLAHRPSYESREGWNELVENNLVNCWDDDAGNQYCEVGSQLDA